MPNPRKKHVVLMKAGDLVFAIVIGYLPWPAKSHHCQIQKLPGDVLWCGREWVRLRKKKKNKRKEKTVTYGHMGKMA